MQSHHVPNQSIQLYPQNATSKNAPNTQAQQPRKNMMIETQRVVDTKKIMSGVDQIKMASAATSEGLQSINNALRKSVLKPSLNSTQSPGQSYY
jgi:hypothetical protein